MNIDKLKPSPAHKELFQRDKCRHVPELAGCYVLTTFTQEVLYVGLADNLRRRMGQHLDDPNKTNTTALGRAFFFHWVVGKDINKIERTWMNIHRLQEGALPILNSIFSPVSI